jgi:hypothetical protein
VVLRDDDDLLADWDFLVLDLLVVALELRVLHALALRCDDAHLDLLRALRRLRSVHSRCGNLSDLREVLRRVHIREVRVQLRSLLLLLLLLLSKALQRHSDDDVLTVGTGEGNREVRVRKVPGRCAWLLPLHNLQLLLCAKLFLSPQASGDAAPPARAEKDERDNGEGDDFADHFALATLCMVTLTFLGIVLITIVAVVISFTELGLNGFRHLLPLTECPVVLS